VKAVLTTKLAPKADSTQLTLTQGGFAGQRDAMSTSGRGPIYMAGFDEMLT
jgi:hypothetical protein